MRIYMAYTWLLANLLHPLFIMFFYGVIDLSVYLFTFIYSLVISLPSFFLSQLAGYFLVRIKNSIMIQLLVWMLIAPLIVVLNFILMFVIIGSDTFSFFDLNVMIPALLSVFFVVLIRYQYFFKACIPVKYQELDDPDQISEHAEV